MTDEEMVAYLARCQLDPSMPRPSIETLLHAFVPHPARRPHPSGCDRLDRRRDRRRASRRRSASAPTRSGSRTSGPGFALSKLVAEAVRSSPEAKHRPARQARARHLGRDRGGVVRVDPRCDQPGRRVCRRAQAGRRGRSAAPRAPPLDARSACRSCSPRSCRPFAAPCRSTARACSRSTLSPAVLEFVAGRDSRELSQVGAACPDHLVHTKRRPAWVEFDPDRDDAAALRDRLVEQVRDVPASASAPTSSSTGPTGDTLLDPEPPRRPDRGRRPRQRRTDAEGSEAGA